jgi:Flp pilus assembly protein TadD
MSPDDPSLLEELGTACLVTRRIPQAVVTLQRSISFRPTSGETHWKLARALEQAGDREAALAHYRRASALAPSLLEAHVRVAELLLERGKPEEEAAAYEQAALAGPRTTLGHLSLAKSLMLKGRPREAQPHLALLLRRDPSCTDAHILQGIILSEIGSFDEAAASFERAIALAPSDPTAHHGLVTAKRLTAADQPLVDRIEARLEAPDLPPAVRATLHFAAGKAKDDLEDYVGAIHHFDAANVLRRRLARPFDARDFEERVTRWISHYSRELFESASAVSEDDETPILVLGMPRSGTTLVERILSSHPSVAGAGELPYWNINGPAWVEADLPTLEPVAARLRRDYLDVLRVGRRGATRVTDKMPFNFLWAGLVHLLLPRARIVHCRRDPLDTCVSIYSTLFAQSWGFASDRRDLALYYRQYARLIEHWRSVLPEDRFLDVDYEAVIRSPESEAMRLIRFAGLEWSPLCAAPEKNPTVVRTASKWQARQPVFQRSVGRWRHYEPWLGALSSLREP